MATREERTFEHNGLEIDVIMTVGHNEDELYYPGGQPVPDGRQEIVCGIADVRYNTQRGSGQEPNFEVFNHDVGLLERENVEYKTENAKLKREINVLRKRLEAFGISLNAEDDA